MPSDIKKNKFNYRTIKSVLLLGNFSATYFARGKNIYFWLTFNPISETSCGTDFFYKSTSVFRNWFDFALITFVFITLKVDCVYDKFLDWIVIMSFSCLKLNFHSGQDNIRLIYFLLVFSKIAFLEQFMISVF